MPAAGEFPVNGGAGAAQAARIVSQATVNQAAQSEMRIGLTTAAFGNVEVRAVVRANEVGVQIGSERGDLRSLLSNELPAIANTLQQQNLRLNQVSFHQPSPGLGVSSQASSGGNAQPRSFGSRGQAMRGPPGETASSAAGDPALESISESGVGLSIMA